MTKGKPIMMPSRRPLKIFSADPMRRAATGNILTIDVPYEPLADGPIGSRIKVIDYDGAQGCYYSPVNLNDPAILMQNGLDPSESDPRFHQQMVYAVAAKVLENFDRGLGRRFLFIGNKKLRLFPHAYYGANAFFDHSKNGIFFGYFRADKDNPGPNLPNQNVFTCLSHDIIAHEVTHAVVHRLRRHFLEPSNEDVLAFHEAFSDIVALFQHFSFPSILREEIQRTRTNLKDRTMLAELAQQFGYATGSGKALRSALATSDKKLSPELVEPHSRGSILVSAVFDAFFATYQRRIRDLIRIATGGSGNLPDGDLPPDLVNRVASEAAQTAQSFLTMCIRAFDYLPPVDITFGDFLRALVTADYELNPIDEFGQRAAVIDAFRQREILPSGVVSLAEESLLWETAGRDLREIKLPVSNSLPDLLKADWSLARLFDEDITLIDKEQVEMRSDDAIEERNEANQDLAKALSVFGTKYADRLYLSKEQPIDAHGFHWVFRVGRNGQLKIEFVVQFTQTNQSNEIKNKMGGIPFRGGTTVVASADGTIRYLIAKPLQNVPSKQKEADCRYERMAAYVDHCKLLDPQFAWNNNKYEFSHMNRRQSLFGIHQGVF